MRVDDGRAATLRGPQHRTKRPAHRRRTIFIVAAMLVAGLTLPSTGIAGAAACDPAVDPSCFDDTYYYDDTYFDDTYYDDTYYYDDDTYPSDPWATPPDPTIRASAPFSSTTPRSWAYRRVDAVDALSPTTPVPDQSIDATSTNPDSVALHRSIAGRLVLAADALAELRAFALDEDPAVNQTIAELARTVPSAGLEISGYKRELVALTQDIPLLIGELDGEPSDGLIAVVAVLSDDIVARLDAGDMAFIEPLPWLDAVADVLMRGGEQLELASDVAYAADEAAIVDFVSLFGDPDVFWVGELTIDDDPFVNVVSSSSTTAPDLALVDAAPPNPIGETPTGVSVPMLLVAGIVVAVAAIGGFAMLVGRKTPNDEDLDPDAMPTRHEARPAVVTLPIAPPKDEPGSLVELLDASRRMTASLDTADIAAIAVAEARSLVNAEGGIVLRRSADELIPIASEPSELFVADGLESSALRRVVDTGRTVSSVTSEDSVLVDVPAAMAAVAIVANGSVIGALMVVRRPSRQFSPAEVDALEMLAPLVGSALLAAQTHDSATALADLDALTGLANRRSLDRDLGALRPTHIASYVMIDVDHFKNFNDTNGHAAGDVALQLVARSIEGNVRPQDRVYRYGGEEFCVLLPGATSADAAQVAERVRAAVEGSSIAGGEHQPGGRLTISVGVADTDDGIDDIIERADGALYEAKESGRNRVNIAGATNE